MAKLISQEDALNYEIMSTSAFRSFVNKVFFMFFYRRAERKYKRYQEGMKIVDALEILGNQPDTERAEELLEISIDLEKIEDDNALSHQILKLARNNQTLEAIRIIKATAKVNRYMALQVCGDDLLARIEKYLRG